MSRAYPDTGTCRHCGATVPCNRTTGQTRPHPDAALANGVTPDHPCAQLPGLTPAEIHEAKRHRRAARPRRDAWQTTHADPDTALPPQSKHKTPHNQHANGEPMTYLAFTQTHDTGKTKTWAVRNTNDGSHLGTIKWRGGWRKYVLEVTDPTVWSADCLRDAAAFIERRMSERR